MGEVVNLRQARKRADRVRKDAEAEANRVSFGTPKAMKTAARRERDKSAARLDGHRLSAGAETRPENEAAIPSDE